MNFDIKTTINGYDSYTKLNISRDTVRTIDCVTIEFPREESQEYSRSVSVDKEDFVNYLTAIDKIKNISTSVINIPLQHDSFNTYSDNKYLSLKISESGSDIVLLTLSDSNTHFGVNINELIELITIL